MQGYIHAHARIGGNYRDWLVIRYRIYSGRTGQVVGVTSRSLQYELSARVNDYIREDITI